MRRLLAPALLLALGVSPVHAQDLSGRWSVWGRDGDGFYRGTATLTQAGDRVTGRLVLEGLRVAASGAFEPTSRRSSATLEGRVAGRTLRGERRAGAGLAGAVSGGASPATPVVYALEDAGGQLRLVAPDEELREERPGAPRADEARPGDWAAPFVVTGAPFVHASSTVGRRSVAGRYSTRPDLSEAGPEVVYRVDVPARGRLTAWVQGDGAPGADGGAPERDASGPRGAGAEAPGGEPDGPEGPASGSRRTHHTDVQKVDVDVHVLRSLEVDATGQAVACLGRANEVVEVEVEAGPCYVVVDTYRAAARAGAYVLRVDVEPDDAWYERPVARGVTLKTKRYAALFGAVQTGSVLDVDLDAPGVVVKPIAGQGCATTSELGRRAGAVAAINGGYFGPGCQSVSLCKVDDQLRATNAKDRSALGIDRDGRASIALVRAGRDWPGVTQALGGVGRLLERGAIVVAPGTEGSAASFATGRNPRTAVGINASGDLVLATADGRTSAGAGMRLGELAQWMAWLGCEDALNLDGGGSTAMWVQGEPWRGVVNHPSDAGRATHAGERAVSTALAVWARPLDRDAVWLTPAPRTQVAPGAAWSAELALADPEGARVAFRLEGAPPGLTLLDRGDGTARLSWPAAWPAGTAATATLRVVGVVEGSRPVARSLTLSR